MAHGPAGHLLLPLHAAVAAAAQSTTAQIAALTLTGVQGTSTGGAVTTTAQVATLTLTAVQGVNRNGLWPTSISGDSRRILDQNGDPWLCRGDAGWAGMGELTDADWVEYLDALAGFGFNAVLVSAIEGFYSSDPPNDAAGNNPYSSTMFQSSTNEAYWGHIDVKVRAAAARGITLVWAAAYIGFNTDGLASQISAASNAQMEDYGEFIGARYANDPNILWMIGGDRTSVDATLLARSDAMATGIKAQSGQLMTAHQADGATADDVWGAYSWLDINCSYEVQQTPMAGSGSAPDAYADAPTRPTFHVEGLYEQERVSPYLDPGARTLRYQAYAGVISGGCGHVFGNNPRWHFDAWTTAYTHSGDWRDSLDDPTGDLDAGTIHMGHWVDFFTAIDWSTLAPDTTDTFLTAGEGTGTTQAAAAFTTDLAVVYTLSTSSITLDLTEISGASTVRVRRFDPTDGSYTTVGTYSTSGSQSFTHPGNNAFGHSDWVYLIEPSSAQTTVAQVATLTLTGVQGASTTGAVTTTAQTATVILTAVAGTVTAGAVTTSSQTAALVLTAEPGTSTTGEATTSAQPAEMTLTAVPGSSTTGSATTTGQAATLTLTAVAGTSTIAGQTTAQAATLTFTALAGTSTTGAVTTSAQVAELTLTAVQTAVADPNPVTVTVRSRGHTATVDDGRLHTATVRSRTTATAREH